MSAFFLFWDTETDGHNGFRKPLTHSLMQIAWVMTDASCNVLSKQNFLVQGEHTVSRHVPHKLTHEYCNTAGVSPETALTAFLSDVSLVEANGGRIIAHNAAYDREVLAYALTRLERRLVGVNKESSFCSMSHPKIIRFCALPRARGVGFKFPKLAELYTKCHAGRSPPYQLHDALGDGMTLRDSFAH